MAQWDQWHLGSAEAQVRSLALHSELRIWHCHSCGLGHDCGSDLIPGQGTPYAIRSQKRQKKKKERERETKHTKLVSKILRQNFKV